MTEISILGCGWLGLPLAKQFIEDGDRVKGSTTSADKMNVLEQLGIKPYQISVSENRIDGNIEDFLKCDVLIVDIPPRATDGIFTKKTAKLVAEIDRLGIKNVLFVSSISVYPNKGVVTEATPTGPDSASARELAESEEILRTNPNFKTTIVRFGGLVGPDRHPVKHLAGKTGLSNPDAPVNLIHLEDCIGVIQAVIARKAWGETFNAVAPLALTREDFYRAKAAEFSLPLPVFDHSTPSVGKKVLAEKIHSMLGYSFSAEL